MCSSWFPTCRSAPESHDPCAAEILGESPPARAPSPKRTGASSPSYLDLDLLAAADACSASAHPCKPRPEETAGGIIRHDFGEQEADFSNHQARYGLAACRGRRAAKYRAESKWMHWEYHIR